MKSYIHHVLNVASNSLNRSFVLFRNLTDPALFSTPYENSVTQQSKKTSHKHFLLKRKMMFGM